MDLRWTSSRAHERLGREISRNTVQLVMGMYEYPDTAVSSFEIYEKELWAVSKVKSSQVKRSCTVILPSITWTFHGADFRNGQRHACERECFSGRPNYYI